MANLLRFDRFEVDLASGQICRDGERIHLREQSFQILASLLERPGEVVTRDDLRRRLWPDDVNVDFDNNLNSAVARLREALGDSAEHPRFLETLPKRGYRFVAEVHGDAPLPQPARHSLRVVVLPFVNLTGDPGQEYFSDALTDEIITELASVAPGLGVIARTTTMRYKGTEKDVAQIGRELRVDYVVEGAVRGREDRLTITLQLVRASDQTHLLARRYEARLADVFDLRTAIATTLASAIGILPAAGGVRSRRKPTSDIAAYKLYLQARALLITTAENIPKAKQYLLDAIARDPSFALAYDALAELYWYFAFLGLAPSKEVAPIAMVYAIEALNLDDTLAETHALLGILLKEVDLDWRAVEREMDRARELDPAAPLVRLRRALGLLIADMRLEEAAREIDGALEIDPQSTLLRAWLVCMLWLDRRYERAIEEARMVITLDPEAFLGYWVLGLVLREVGRLDESIAAHRTAVALSGDAPLQLGWFALALGEAGRAAEVREILNRLYAIAESQYVPPTALAFAHLALGEIDDVFVWLDRAIDYRDDMIIPLGSYAFLDPIRSDPRFTALMLKLRYDPSGRGVLRTPVDHAAAVSERELVKAF